VYILAFVGAVIMLFLSVVLMLPASIIPQEHSSLIVTALLINLPGSFGDIFYFLILFFIF